MPLRRAVVALVLAGSAAATLAPAQRQPLPPPGGFGAAAGAGAASLDAALEGLLRLPGAHVVVLYPPDHLDRAARLQLRLEGLRRAWQPLTRHDLEWRAALVGPTRWRALAPGAPWGWPARAAGPLFVIPVRADAEIVAAVTALLGGAPPDPGGDPLVGGRDEAGAGVVVDLLAQLEAGRELADAARWRGDEPWIRERCDLVVTMGCGEDACPAFLGKRMADWALEDPKGKDLDAFRRIRDEIERRVRALLAEEGVL